MEEARCWTWAKTKPDLSPQILSSSEAVMNPFPDSWEEQAFAFDSSGSLGGCVWPPRSYSCSFCRREFRSAQALGGHMNVHRRERARLKQSPIISSTTDRQVAANYTSQICSFLCKNPNPEISNTLASHQRNIGIRASPPPCLFSPVVVQDSTSTVVVSSTQPCWSSFVNEKKDLVLGSIDNQEKKSTFVVEKNSKKYMSMSLDFVVRQTDTNGSDDKEPGSYKRRKIEYKPLSFFQESNKLAGGFQTEVFKPSLGSVEELDLELRLGDAPKVK